MNQTDIPARVVNSAFVDKMAQGFEKEAAISATSYIRKILREESFVADKIMTEQPITEDQLDKDENLDMLKKIIEIEPDSTATWVSLRGLPASRYLTQGSGVIYFGLITAEKVTKSIFELKTRDNDVRKIISDNQVKDILEQQDGKFIETCRAIVTNPLWAPTQNRVFNGGLTKVNFIEACKILPSFRIPNGVVLMNESTSKEVLKWDTTDIGFEPVTEHFRKGLTQGTLMGLKFITTIKNNMIPDNEVWFFAPEDFLGKMFTLMDTTVFIKSEGYFFEFFAYKVLGMGIMNTRSVIRCEFRP